jgi:carboxypeptidase T
MKPFSFLFICFTIFTINLFSQDETYSRVRTQLDATHTLQVLAGAGIAVDHGYIIKDKSYTTDLSASEIKQLSRLGFSFFVEIKDVQAHYVNQNNTQTKVSAVTNCTGVTPKQYATPSNFSLGSMGGYFTYQEMLNQLDSMAAKYPNIIKARTAVDTFKTAQLRSIYWLKISDNPNVDEPEPEMLYTSLHHAREPNSLSQQIMYMWYLLENYATNPEIQYLVDNTEMYFIPCVNPDGYVYNQTTNPNGGGQWRKNRRVITPGSVFGVDLNRNYGYNWGYDNIGSSPTTTSGTYRGTSAFSEPETRAVKALCEAHQFKMTLNYHTFGNLLIYPWGYIGNLYTPDSAQFVEYAKFLTVDNNFKYGTGNQTVGYNTNGDSDDWMYGEQTTKPKILSMTPEAGDAADGFWPAQNRIIPICKSNITQNLNIVKLLLKYYRVESYENSTNHFTYNVMRLGMTSSATATVAISAVDGKILMTGPTKVYSNMTLLQTQQDSIAFTIAPTVVDGEKIKLLLTVFNGDITTTDTVTAIAHTTTSNPSVTILYDNANLLSQYWTKSASSTWATTTNTYVSASSSITDSPTGNYANNTNPTLTTTQAINLSSNYSNVRLNYYTKWETEKDYDYVQIQSSINNGTTWENLCGKYTKNLSVGPAYEDVQSTWVYESIDLTHLIGNNVKFRFLLYADAIVNFDGFYFDDFKISGQSILGVEDIISNAAEQVYPNPFSESFTLNLADKNEKLCNIYNAQGQLIKSIMIKSGASISTQNWLKGLYLLQIVGKSDSKTKYLKVLKQ